MSTAIETIDELTAVTRQLRSETNERRRLERVLQLVDVGAWEASFGGDCEWISEVGIRLIRGFDAGLAGLLGYGWGAWVHPEDREGVMSRWGGSVSTGREMHIRFRFLHDDGREMPVSCVARQNGIGWVGTITRSEIVEEVPRGSAEFS